MSIRYFWYILLAVLVLFCALLLAAFQSPSVKQSFNNSTRTAELNNCNASTELETPSLHHESNEFAPNNLPYLHGPFVGRESELIGISNMLLSSSAGVAMVSIFGPPAVGKSTLAIHVGCELASKGVSVRYFNLNEAHHLFARQADASDKPTSMHSTDDSTDLIFQKADIKIPWDDYAYSNTEDKYVLTSSRNLIPWAKELTNDTLLILDNCDDFLQTNEAHANNFKKMLIELLKASKYLRILTTSRAQMLFVGAFRPYLLKELDPTSAVTLLQLRSDLITSDDGKVIAELVGYNPLALGIVAELINIQSSPPRAIINELEKHLMRTLSQSTLPNHQRIFIVLKLSYDYLSDRIQVCSHYLSHFPGSFHRAAAQSISSKCDVSDPEYCLQTLVERSLLEEYWHTDQPRYQHRYQFHRLIREFLHDVQTKYRDKHDKIHTKFNLYYELYYSEEIFSLSQNYSRSPVSTEIASGLEHDMHNFKSILQRMVKLHVNAVAAVNILSSFLVSSDFIITELYFNCGKCISEFLQVSIIYFRDSLSGHVDFDEVGINNISEFSNMVLNSVTEWLSTSKLRFGFSTEHCVILFKMAIAHNFTAESDALVTTSHLYCCYRLFLALFVCLLIVLALISLLCFLAWYVAFMIRCDSKHLYINKTYVMLSCINIFIDSWLIACFAFFCC